VTAVFRPFWNARGTDADIGDEASPRLRRGGQPGRGEAGPVNTLGSAAARPRWPTDSGERSRCTTSCGPAEGRRALAAAGEQVARIRRPPDVGWGALARDSMVSISERIGKW
jgi:hypothetical protein